MRAHLLATTAAVALLAGTSAHAIDGTWQGPGNQWTAGANWSSSPAVPNGTATFTGNTPTSVFITSNATINTIEFTTGAPAYTFTSNLQVTERLLEVRIRLAGGHRCAHIC